MRTLKKLFSKEPAKDIRQDSFSKPEKEYLETLIRTANKKFEQFEYSEINDTSCDIFYMPTKKESYIGLQLGLSEQARLLKRNIKESAKLRSDCKNYIKILKQDDKVIKIESIINGKTDSTYLAYYENDFRYLFPYTMSGHRYPTYMSVVHFEGDEVTEEYMVQRNQILYKKYGRPKGNKVDYYYINYVPNGKHAALEETCGYYLTDTLEYVEKERYVWTQDR